MFKKITIIDADSLLYQASKETLEESITIIDEKIHNILDSTKAKLYKLFISKGPYFRHNIDQSYKSKRAVSNLKWLKTLKSYLIEQWNAFSINGLEADDICSIILHDTPKFNTIRSNITLASTDKDLLLANHGRHFKYSYSINNNVVTKGTWIETSEEDADRFVWLQMLMGDSTDGIIGVNGIGKVNAEKILRDIPTLELPYEVLRVYLKHYNQSNGIELYRKNYKLLNMLKTTNEYEELFNKDFPDIIWDEYE